MLKLLSVCAGFGIVAMAAALSAQGQPGQNPAELKVGDMAPAFALQGSDGKIGQQQPEPAVLINVLQHAHGTVRVSGAG